MGSVGSGIDGAGELFRTGALVIIRGLVSRAELNGKLAVVLGPPNENDRIPIETCDAGSPSQMKLAVRPANVEGAVPAPAPAAMPAPIAKVAGYPTEPVKRVFDASTQSELVVPSRKETQQALKRLPLDKQLFGYVRDERAKLYYGHKVGGPTTVDEATFRQQFEWFTWGVADWDPDMWKHVLVAGGAVLASLLPPMSAADMRRMKKFGDLSWLEFDIYYGRMRNRSEDGPPSTDSKFFREVRWPTADIDLFIHGLDAEAAQSKLLTILARLQRALVRKHGVQNDVYFIQTANTVTVGCGALGRTVQVILRLYEDTAAILNGFDIDCCCIGFDGEHTLITPRAIAALNTKTNMIDLDIRGASYETRLLKYVERGFAIGVPLLDNSKRDRDYLAMTKIKCHYSGYDTLSGNGWSKWANAEDLAKLLMADSFARAFNGIIERPFPGRERHREECERAMHMSIKPYPKGIAPVRDSYTSRDKAGNPIWPATTKLEAFQRAEAPFKVVWQEGNMPRRPKTWEEWSASAYVGAKRNHGWSYDPEKYHREREEREQREKEKRIAEIDAARKEAAAEAAAEAERLREETETIKRAAAEKEEELKHAKKEAELKAVGSQRTNPRPRASRIAQCTARLRCGPAFGFTLCSAPRRPRGTERRRAPPRRARRRSGSSTRRSRSEHAWKSSSHALVTPKGSWRSSPRISYVTSAWTVTSASCLSYAATYAYARRALPWWTSARCVAKRPRARWPSTYENLDWCAVAQRGVAKAQERQNIQSGRSRQR